MEDRTSDDGTGIAADCVPARNNAAENQQLGRFENASSGIHRSSMQHGNDDDDDDDNNALSSTGSSAISRSSRISSDSGIANMQQEEPQYQPELPTIEGSSNSSSSISPPGASSPPVNLRARARPLRRTYSPPPPEYRDIKRRLESFRNANWPANYQAQPDSLSKAGFYWVGPLDRVKCGYCGGRLKRWLETDNALEEHIRHFPHCEHVQNIEQQTAVLSQNLRTDMDAAQFRSSRDLMQEQRQKQHKKRSSSKVLWRKTLKKLGYKQPIISTAETSLRTRNKHMNLDIVLREVQRLQKEHFFSERHEVSDEGVCSSEESEPEEESSEEEEEEEERGQAKAELLYATDDERVRKLQSEVGEVTKERDDLREMLRCKICLEKPADTLFLTCRHFSTCNSCAEKVRDCPICRQTILGTVDVFMA